MCRFGAAVREAMSDNPLPTFASATAAILAFRDARDWKQFHTARQLAAGLAIEAAELQQTMLWKTDAEVEVASSDAGFRSEVGDELADVLSFALLLAHHLSLDPGEPDPGEAQEERGTVPCGEEPRPVHEVHEPVGSPE